MKFKCFEVHDMVFQLVNNPLLISTGEVEKIASQLENMDLLMDFTVLKSSNKLQ